MAVRLLQLCTLFAIGVGHGPASVEAAAEIPLTLHLEDPPSRMFVGRGQSMTIPCVAHSVMGAGPLRTTWLHDNQSLPVETNTTSLTIERIERGKHVEGNYQCLVRNDQGALLSQPANLVIASISRDFSQSPQNTTVNEQQSIVLNCRIQSKPNAIVHWEKDDQPLPQSIRFIPLPSGSLLITSAQSSDSGRYRCLAFNTVLNKTRRSRYGSLTINYPMAIAYERPNFLDVNIAHNHTVVHVGESVRLYCAVAGAPSPIQHWLRSDGVVIGNASVLELENVSLEMAGNYSCSAYNSEGRIIQYYYVDVVQGPYFNITPVSKSYPPAKTVRLECQALGVPTPTIAWLKNGEPLPTNLGRIKQQRNSLVLSHSFTTDAGIYQCVASNRVGTIWAAAQLMPYFSENRPKPPHNVECHPFDETSICLQWDSVPNPSVFAYSIYSLYAGQGQDYVTNATFLLADNLNNGTNYTFYVRSYSKEASDQSRNVTCTTGVKGERNLQVKQLTVTSVQLTWSAVSNDLPCGDASGRSSSGNGSGSGHVAVSATRPPRLYKIQWKKAGQVSVSREFSSELKHIIKGLRPTTEYEFRVQSTTNRNDASPWVAFALLANEKHIDATIDTHTAPDLNAIITNESRSSNVLVLDTPNQLEADPLTPSSVNLTWNGERDEEADFYVVCFIEVRQQTSCDKGALIKSENNFVAIRDLKPNTLYEFQVRTESHNGQVSPFSHSIELQTLAALPSAVQDLKYRLINSTCVCFKWRPPKSKNGNLIKYQLSYTPDQNWPLEKWHYVDVVILTQSKTKPCWHAEPDAISTVLTGLQSATQYTVMVRAENEAGMGNPAVPITFTTKRTELITDIDKDLNESTSNVDHKRNIGIAVGLIISLVCISVFGVVFIWRNRILKRRQQQQQHRGCMDGNVDPHLTQLSSGDGGALQIRRHAQVECAAEAHEMQQLVLGDDRNRLRTANFSLEDPKDGPGLPNGHTQMNGHIANGHVHITENPRFDFRAYNGHLNLIKRWHHVTQQQHQQQLPQHLELADYNSNCSSDFDDAKLNETQLTRLDEEEDALLEHRLGPAPALAPNG